MGKGGRGEGVRGKGGKREEGRGRHGYNVGNFNPNEMGNTHNALVPPRYMKGKGEMGNAHNP